MIGGLAPATPYPANEPVYPNSVLFLGDLHMGRGANATAHAATARTDLLRYDLPLLVQVGDMDENGTSAEDTTALGVLAGLPATTVRTIVGNHDVQQPAGAPRTADAAATAWGLPGTKNWTFDMGDFLVIAVSQDGPENPLGGDGSDPTVRLSASTLDWLDAQLAAATKECWCVGHAPLGVSTVHQFRMQPADTLNALLDARQAATCWFSGHTHSGFDDATFNVLFDLGTRSIVNANASAIAYVDPNDDATDPVRSLLATHIDGGAELRIRDHTHRWYQAWPGGQLVKTLQAT